MQIQQKYLHTIGNLTITGYNSELGDLSFLEKRDRDGGFASSPLSLNHELAKLDRWTKDEIEKRAHELTDLSVHIWPAPDLDSSLLEKYKPIRPSESDHVYTEEDHLINGDSNTKQMYITLRDKVLQLGSDIRLHIERHYIGFAKNRNFITIKIRRAYLLADLTTHDGFQDPKGISIQPNLYGGKVRRVRVGSEAIFDDLLPLIQQSYEKA
jgi:predicted transport protein